MPREVIHSATAEEDSPTLSVGWGRDYPDIEIGSLLTPDATREQLRVILLKHGVQAPEVIDSVLDALTEPYSGAMGWYAHLDRNGVNRLIRILRKARDQSFGADA